MKARNSRVLTSASKIIGAAALSVLLVACGGGTSGDVLDGDLDPDPDFSDLDNELGGDNIDDLGEEENIVIVEGIDADDNGIPDEAEGLVCKGRGGSDPDSSNNSWADNCVVEPFIRNSSDTDWVNGPFQKSYYVQGMQRILACREYGGASESIDAFADGAFGDGTVEALREFQADQGLIVDGIVNDETWAELQSLVFNLNNRVDADSDEAFIGYGVTRVANPTTDIDCSQVSSFYGVLATEGADLFSGWRLALTHGSLVPSTFSIDPLPED